MNIENLKTIANKATQGNWTWEDDENNVATVYSGRDNTPFKGTHGLNLFGRLDPDWNGKNNLDFITTFNPQFISTLLKRLEELEKNEQKTNI